MTIDDVEVQRALDLTPASTAWERTVDVTTIGRRSGQPRRIEIWMYRHAGRTYLSGLPAPRDWLANVRADPHVVLHLKHGVRADLPALGRVIDDAEQRRQAFSAFVADLNQPGNPARIRQPTRLEDWLEGSALVELVFTRPSPSAGARPPREAARRAT